MGSRRCEYGRDERIDRNDDYGGLRRGVKNPIDVLGQRMRLGNHRVQEHDRRHERHDAKRNNARGR